MLVRLLCSILASFCFFFFFNDTATTEIYTLSLHDALPISGGERQRVAVGRALLMRPRLLILDEPLASLDAARKREILPYLVRLRDEAHMPMVYVSHHPGELRRIAKTVVWLDGGRVMNTGGLELL